MSSYHHGDLRRTVMSAALDVIASEGPSALSLRDLARRAGVSHAAPAHHFKDRAGLLTAIATEGYELLADALSAASGLKERGVAYVHFATGHPAHFQVMFQPDLHRPDDPGLTAAKARANAELITGVTAEGLDEDTESMSLAAWSVAHGFATLLLSHNLDKGVGERTPEEAFRAMTGVMFRQQGSDPSA